MDSSFAKFLVDVARLVYEKPLALEPTASGTSPMYVLARLHPMPMNSIGVSWPGANVHAPDESLRLEDYRRGVKYVAALLDRFAACP